MAKQGPNGHSSNGRFRSSLISVVDRGVEPRPTDSTALMNDRLASELLTQNLPWNPPASRPFLALSNPGWYTPGKEGNDGTGGAATAAEE